MDFVAMQNETNLKMTQDINTINDDEVKSDLQEFYKGAKIFLTGGTGFMGKMMIDKLLRSCSEIETIYLLVRPKKGKDVHSRLEEIFDDPVFKRLRNEVPKFRHKIVAIQGDCAIAGLGLKLTDRQILIDNANMVIHAAATVRFDEKLRLAININVHGTRDILDLCSHINQLKVVIHVSTAYSNCHLRRIEEKFYKYPISFDDLDRLIEKLDDNELDAILPKLLGKWPNTYAFTKALAEDIVRQKSGNLPIGMFRPAIITSSVREPVVGWIDNLYGPTGVVAGAGTGVLRTMHCDRDINANVVPVDMTVNALLASGWDIARRYAERKEMNINNNTNTNNNNNNNNSNNNSNNDSDVPIYNYVSSVEKPLTWGEFTELNLKLGFTHPFSSAIWYICFHVHKTATMNKIYMLFLHFLPAMLIDSLALCVGQKPRLLKIYKKIHKFANVISFFCTREWTFTNDNVQTLWLRLSKQDQSDFDFNMKNMDWMEYLRHYIPGMRLYLFKEDESTLETALIKWNRFYWLHQCLKALLSFLVLYFFWSIFSGLFFSH